MSRIHIWKVRPSTPPRAEPLEGIRSSETERMLEDILVASPDLLQHDLVLVGRQVQTAGGPLDLLGVDDEGQLVVFELKRGILTREAVGQVLDYASDLAGMSNEKLARLIEEHSGRHGIDQITDFLEWYGQEHPTQAGPLAQKPRMVLVGLGADERALRVVNFLAETGVEIQLLTFHAFRAGGEIFLAKQVESEAVTQPLTSGMGTKEGNRRVLLDKAATLGVDQFLATVASVVESALGIVYVWPHKSLYSFNVDEETAEGRPTQRYVVSLAPDEQQRGTLRLAVPERVVELGEDVVAQFEKLGARRVASARYAMAITLDPHTWSQVQAPLEDLLRLIRRRWEERRRRKQEVSHLENLGDLGEAVRSTEA